MNGVKGLLFSMFLFSSNVFGEPQTEIIIEAGKEGLNSSVNVYSFKTGVNPTSMKLMSIYGSILNAMGGIASKITSIAMNEINSSKCRSKTHSYDDMQNVCEFSPSFENGKFCIVNVDNLDNTFVNISIYSFDPFQNSKSNEITSERLNNRGELCIRRPIEAEFLDIKNFQNDVILSRPMPVDLFTGEYGAIIKNGNFYLKKKDEAFHSIMGYHLCPRVMYDTPGWLSQDELAKRCLNGLKEENIHISPKYLDTVFTKHMKSIEWSDISRSFQGNFDDDYILTNGSIDFEITPLRVGGLFVFNPNTYVYVDPQYNRLSKRENNVIKLTNFSYKWFYVPDRKVINVLETITAPNI